MEARKRLYRDLKGKTYFDGLVGSSPRMLEIIERIEQVGPTQATVLIDGESGTGKELVARAIHKARDRANKPLVVVNCAALPEDLLEAELFGTEPGAFTGAVNRMGRCEMAIRGRSFSTRSASYRKSCRRSFSGSCKSARSSASVAGVRSAWTRAWWRRRIETFASWCNKGNFARICTIACGCTRSSSRRCASGRKTFRCSSTIS